MGQLCSSDQIQHDHRNSQNLQRKKTDFTLPQNTNDHYSQSNIEAPPAPLFDEEIEKNPSPKAPYHPENGHANPQSGPSPYGETWVKPGYISQQENNWVKPDHYYQQNKENPDIIAQKKQNKRHQIPKECPSCQETYEILYQKPVFTNCQHGFCSDCLQRALKIQPYCPICYTYQSESLYNAKGEQIYDVKEGSQAEPISHALWNLDFVRTVVGDEVKKEARNIFWQRRK